MGYSWARERKREETMKKFVPIAVVLLLLALTATPTLASFAPRTDGVVVADQLGGRGDSCREGKERCGWQCDWQCDKRHHKCHIECRYFGPCPQDPTVPSRKWVLTDVLPGKVFEVYNVGVEVGEVVLDSNTIYGYILPGEQLSLQYWDEQKGNIVIGALTDTMNPAGMGGADKKPDINIAVGVEQLAAEYSWVPNPDVPPGFDPDK